MSAKATCIAGDCDHEVVLWFCYTKDVRVPTAAGVFAAQIRRRPSSYVCGSDAIPKTYLAVFRRDSVNLIATVEMGCSVGHFDIGLASQRALLSVVA